MKQIKTQMNPESRKIIRYTQVTVSFCFKSEIKTKAVLYTHQRDVMSKLTVTARKKETQNLFFACFFNFFNYFH